MPNHVIAASENSEADGVIRVDVSSPPEAAPGSARLVEVGLRFGVPLTAPGREIAAGLPLNVRPGTITLITGPSGAGKSLLLAAIARRFATARFVHHLEFPSDVAIVDAVAPTRPVDEALGLLTACGLGEPMLWIRRFSQLSDGEQFRARLARAISLHWRTRSTEPLDSPAPLLCDEFGSILHERLAKALAFNLRKLATRERLAMVIATSRCDLEEDLRPDTIVRLGGPTPLVEKAVRPRETQMLSFARRLRILRGTLADYAAFSSMHYRQRCTIGFVDKVFVCREGLDGPPLGVIVYAHPSLELKLRNQVTRHSFCRQAQRLNRELRVLKRLIIHPDVRGCGIGHWLVRRTLPLVGTRFVECLAAMGAVNPVFARAGMRRIGVCEAPDIRDKSLAQLRAAGIDPCSADFVSQVCRRPAVRRIVARCVLTWYRGMSCNSAARTAHQTPGDLARTFRQLIGSEPVYYIWAADQQGWDLIERGIASHNMLGGDAKGERPRPEFVASPSLPGGLVEATAHL
jgi:ABC-type lipoprotein export system ATPase subunit